jgi:CopG family transcriptional regulator / antitoxin EndoAI
VDRAVRHYIKELGATKIKKLLKEGAIARSERDLRMAEEWFPLEEEAWRKT